MVIPFGAGWRFGPASAGSSLPGFDDSAFATVTLPHTVTPLSWQDWDPASWERVWTYRKHFDGLFDGFGAGRRVFLDVGAALTHSTVTLNGTQVGDYLGGYLPFSCEITAALQPTANVLAVQLDSTFNQPLRSGAGGGSRAGAMNPVRLDRRRHVRWRARAWS